VCGARQGSADAVDVGKLDGPEHKASHALQQEAAKTPLRTHALKLGSKCLLRVFPCIERTKKPAINDWPRRATTDPNIINGWWRTRDFNIGIATGPDTGIWVLDIDDDEGEALLRQLEAEHGEALPSTVEAITGTGRHVYFRWPTGYDIRNKQDCPLMPGIDVRGDGGYVLAPPSIHPCGRAYAWSVDSANEFADAPEWLIELVTAKSRANHVAAATPPEAWRKFINELVEGSHRAHAIAKLYGYLVRKYVDPIVALNIVRMFNAQACRPPLDDWDVSRIADDIARREADRREGL
jgi:hypothetical protein